MILYLRTYFLTLVAVFFLLPSSVLAATLGLSPANTTTNTGSIITERVYVSSTDQAMNAISGIISFPADLLQVVSITRENSVLSLWVEDPTFSNTEGSISFSGVVPNPGYSGSHGQVISIQFRGRKEGTAVVTFSPSQVLANDGNGTDILTNTNSAAIIITPSAQTPVPLEPTTSPTNPDLLARITSSTHPDQTQWYNLPHAVFDWTNAERVSAIRLGYDGNAAGTPSVLYTDPISHKELDLADGIWYFHVQEKRSGAWGPIATYRVQIDTVPPLPFTVTFPNGTTTQSGSTLTAQFKAFDEFSGIGHYQISVDGKEFSLSPDEGSKPYTVTGDPGIHLFMVRAYDKAGNISTAYAKFGIIGGEKNSPFDFFTFGWLAINYISLVLIALAILITLLFAAWYIRTHFTAYRRRLNHRLGLTSTHVHREFDTLKEALTAEILSLEQAKSKRSLTQNEERLITRFKKLLDQSEQAIESEIESIEK